MEEGETSLGERRPALRFAGIFAAVPLAEVGGYDVPWVPTRRVLVAKALDLARLSPGETLYDLGCGDGRVAIEAARRGARAVCVEIREDLIEKARENAEKAGVADKIEFVNASFFEVDLSGADVVYMYLLTRVNAALRPKLERELRGGARVVTLDFQVPGWRPVIVERTETGGMPRALYLYLAGVSWRRR
jgi:ubiquinone/menaquinone biosynthesis C-methylase UbiE